MDSIKAKLSGWKAKNLSLAGRITLANSILQAIPIYPMLTAKFPLLTCQEIDKIVRDFVWSSTENGRHMHLVRWDEVCKAKCQGGLRLRKAEDVNKILLMKLGWRFLSNPSALWVRLLKAKYSCKDGSPNHLQPRLGCSNTWRGLCSIWDLVMQGTSWQIGDGKSVRFWKDN